MPINYEDFQSAGICNTLLIYTRDQNSKFHKYHYINPKRIYEAVWEKEYKFICPDQKDLEDFLKSTNDEVRLKKADKYSAGILFISDMLNAVYFRDAIMRKELSGDLDYSKQRDHAAHTLYNYLIGWFFFEKCQPIHDEFVKHINNREIDLDPDPDENSLKAFGTIWTYASLLHDIGYLLQGSLSNLSPEVEVAHVTRGARIIHDYFNHYFWRDMALDFHAARDVVKHIKLYVPDFKSIQSIAALSDQLSVMGDCEPIRLMLKDEVDKSQNKNIKAKYRAIIKVHDRLDIDSFKLWELHYYTNNNPTTAQIIDHISDIYKDLVWDGLPQSNSRTINHAVASGLLSLMFSTFFYQIIFGVQMVKHFNEKIIGQLKKLEDKINEVLALPAPVQGVILKKFPTYKILTKEIRNSIIFGYEYGILYKENRLFEMLDTVISQIEGYDRQQNNIIDINIEFVRFKKRIEYEKNVFYAKYNFILVSKYLEDVSKPLHFDKYTAMHWFSLVLWGTAAASVHDIVQNEKVWGSQRNKDFISSLNKKRKSISGILMLEDCPLSYLGVLVDVIQEWDRYGVKKDDIFSENNRLQGIEVDLSKIAGTSIIKFTYPKNKKFTDDTTKTLNFSLVDWKKYLELS